MRIYPFEGPHAVCASSSLTAAEASFEATDVENHEYVFFGDDGTVISPFVRNDRVVLTSTDEQGPEELRERLRTLLVQPRMTMNPALAEILGGGGPRLFANQGAGIWPASRHV